MPLADSFWSVASTDAISALNSSLAGLSPGEATRRLAQYGPNVLERQRRRGSWIILLSQFKSPIILLLLFAAVLSAFLGDSTDMGIIFAIVLISGVLGFWQERGAAQAVAKLLAMVQVKVTVLRGGAAVEVPLEQVVPGDVVVLDAGDLVPGDCLLLDSTDLYVDEATLTGETFPVEKTVGVLPAATALSGRTNSVFMGTHVVSGVAHALVVKTGQNTEFGAISQSLQARSPETEFEHGVRRFGYFLMEVTLVLVLGIFFFNVLLHKPPLDSFMFSLALAVGLTPQLLPAIISVNLAHGAKRLAEEKVIVKRLASIENFGSMDVLCSDKTGTLTQGQVKMHGALDLEGKDSDRVLLYAYLNAINETGFANPIDEAVRTFGKRDVAAWKKLDEVPYDFTRKRLTIVVTDGGDGQGNLMITKGALPQVLAVCTQAEKGGQTVALDGIREQVDQRYHELSDQGFRLLGIAYKRIGATTDITKDEEKEMVLLGLLAFFDPPKPEVAKTITDLAKLGISLKIITGDNRLVAASVSRQVGLPSPRVLAGPDLHALSDAALAQQVSSVDIFAEVEPNQKERLILALRKAGHVVGYMGDGINDASALHAADVGISVNSAVDVAKEAAQIVLLEQDLSVVVAGVQEGRRTFANTLKYVYMATSANFGNMFSMAGASLFLPFLPLLPKQVLLMNLLTDFPEMTIATDSVDPELVETPRRWRVADIRNFMLVFGTLSSVFDYATFAVLVLLLHANEKLFQTGWFVESVVSAALIVLVVRTRRPAFRSRPSKYLLGTTLAVVAGAIILPFTALGGLFGFVPLPPIFLPYLAGIVLAYIGGAEVAKHYFYRRWR